MQSYNLNEAAGIAKVHPHTLRKMAAAKPPQVPATKVGRRWLFPTHLFDAWIEKKCLYINVPALPTGGTNSQSLASRLAKRRAQLIAKTPRSLSIASTNDNGDSTSSEINRRYAGARLPHDG